MAKDGPGGEKTEPATAKKLQDARKEGQVAKSKDLGNAISLFAMFISLKIFLPYIGQSFLEAFYLSYGKFIDVTAESNQNFTIDFMHSIMIQMVVKLLLIMLPLFLIGAVVAFITDLVQVKWKVTSKPLQPKFSKINPASGFKRIFSSRSLVELIKSIAIISLLVLFAYLELKDKFIYLFYFYELEAVECLSFIGDLIINLGFKLSAVLLIIGTADYIYQKYKFNQDMKMTKQEVKDEFKNTEGNPEIKAQIRRKMRQASQRRMMQSVPEADVVITNPTHFAVAIKYEPGTSRAPVVLAKGEDYLAQKIKDAAKEHDIEIVENKPLARALYYNVDIGAEIPPELYQAVAEVLAFVYKVKNKEYHG
ncbi:MAG: flagellar biosynthesis protein FlhB [Lachnospiraceae bacterium]|nr:flagellar biosynthesis protein FlhB [Lachnospiraceae bacterium]